MLVSALLFRAICKKGDIERDKDYRTPDDVLRFDNLRYGKSKKSHVLDIYRPKSATNPDGSLKKLPVIVDVHGGGWVYGDKELYQFYCMNLAQRGFAVINFTYRLGPVYNFRDQLEDTNNALKFVFENADKYQLDTENIFFAGDSAGAHLSAFYGAICTDKELASKFKFKVPENFVPKALLLNCGVYQFEAMMAQTGIVAHVTKNIAKCCIGKAFITKKDLFFPSPVNHINKNFPTCYVMSSNEDPFRDQVPLLTQKLDENGIKYKSKIYGSDEIRLGHVFHIDIKTESAELCNKEETDFLKSLIK